MQRYRVLFFQALAIILTGLYLTSCDKNSTDWQGYIEGRFTYISANFSGVLQQLFVQRGTTISTNTPLFILEQQPESDNLKQAQAQQQQAKAQLQFAEVTFKRQQTLYSKGATQQESLDSARTDLAKAQAQLQQSEATLTQAQWSQAQKAVVAPKNALVFDTYYESGELVPAGQPVLALLAPQDIYAVFYVPEDQLAQIHLKQQVQITCDGCAAAISAAITFISPQAEYTPPIIYSDEMRAKLVFRIEAKTDLANAIKLHPGQPVNIKVIN